MAPQTAKNSWGDFLTSTEAAALLGVRRQTLYVYVGRKGIRSQSVAGTRERRYWKPDVERVLRKGDGSQTPRERPRFESELTLLTHGDSYYRGKSVNELAQHVSLEAVASLLWGFPEEILFNQSLPMAPPLFAKVERLLAGESESNRISALFPLLEEANPRAHDLSPLGIARTGVDVIRWSAALYTGELRPRSENVHIAVAKTLKLSASESDLLRRLLVLAADHGFEESAAAVRAISSTGVTPWRSVMVGYSAKLGRRNIDRYESARRLMLEVVVSRKPAAAIVRHIREAESIPGFGSLEYPQGDPRARALLAVCRKVYKGDERMERFCEAINVVRDLRMLEPTFDLVCVFVEHQLGATSEHSPFFIGRTVGWIAHAIEQQSIGEMGNVRGVCHELKPKVAAFAEGSGILK